MLSHWGVGVSMVSAVLEIPLALVTHANGAVRCIRYLSEWLISTLVPEPWSRTYSGNGLDRSTPSKGDGYVYSDGSAIVIVQVRS